MPYILCGKARKFISIKSINLPFKTKNVGEAATALNMKLFYLIKILFEIALCCFECVCIMISYNRKFKYLLDIGCNKQEVKWKIWQNVIRRARVCFSSIYAHSRDFTNFPG